MSYKEVIERLEMEVKDRLNVINSLRKLNGLEVEPSALPPRRFGRRARGTITVEAAILKALESGRPLDTDRIRIEATKLGARAKDRVFSSLAGSLCRRGAIHRLARGYYQLKAG